MNDAVIELYRLTLTWSLLIGGSLSGCGARHLVATPLKHRSFWEWGQMGIWRLATRSGLKSSTIQRCFILVILFCWLELHVYYSLWKKMSTGCVGTCICALVRSVSGNNDIQPWGFQRGHISQFPRVIIHTPPAGGNDMYSLISVKVENFDDDLKDRETGTGLLYTKPTAKLVPRLTWSYPKTYIDNELSSCVTVCMPSTFTLN